MRMAAKTERRSIGLAKDRVEWGVQDGIEVNALTARRCLDRRAFPPEGIYMLGALRGKY